MKAPRLPVHVYALAAMLFWGGSFVWTTLLLNYFSPVTIIFIRLLISAFFLFSIIIATGRWQPIQGNDRKWLLLSAVFNPFLYFLGENYGVMYTSSTVSAIIIATIPVFSPLAAWIAYRERLTPMNFAGIGVSFAGIVIMLVNRDLTLTADLRGVLFLMGAVVAALFYSVLLKKLTVNYSPLLIVATQNLIGIFLFLPIFLIFEFRELSTAVINTEVILAFLLLSILASSLSFVFFTRTVKELGITKANIFSNLIPVFTAIFSYLILSEELNLRKFAGMFMVILGVYLSERNKPKRATTLC